MWRAHEQRIAGASTHRPEQSMSRCASSFPTALQKLAAVAGRCSLLECSGVHSSGAACCCSEMRALSTCNACWLGHGCRSAAGGISTPAFQAVGCTSGTRLRVSVARNDLVRTCACLDMFVSLSVVPGPSVDAIECFRRVFKCYASRNPRATKLRSSHRLCHTVS